MAKVMRTKPFQSGNSQAIRLPKDFAYPKDAELTVVRSGEVTTIYPAARTIREMVKRLRKIPNPPSIEERDVIEIPERPGL